jgi:hypothetical protein
LEPAPAVGIGNSEIVPAGAVQFGDVGVRLKTEGMPPLTLIDIDFVEGEMYCARRAVDAALESGIAIFTVTLPLLADETLRGSPNVTAFPPHPTKTSIKRRPALKMVCRAKRACDIDVDAGRVRLHV